MLRKDREVPDREVISQIIRSCQVCRLGLVKNNEPYIVPVSFGFDGRALYFHTARKGRKIGFLRAHGTVCFEFEHGVQLVPDPDSPCEWTFAFQSVIGYGKAQELMTNEDRTFGLTQIMAQYSDQEWAFSEKMMRGLRVWKIEIETITAKQSVPESIA